MTDHERDVRDLAILRALDGGMTRRQISSRFNVNARWLKMFLLESSE